MTFKKTFTNELGGGIDLRVSYADTLGRVTIYIAGPNSVSENIITVLEARELRDALNKVIR